MAKTAPQEGQDQRKPKRKGKRITHDYFAEYLNQSVDQSRIEKAMNRPETTQVVEKPRRDTFILLVISVLLLGSGVIWLIYAVL